MGRWRNQEWHGCIERFAVVAYLICFLTGTLFAEALSGKIHENLIKTIQDELDRQYRSAQMTEELFPGATVAFVLPDGKVMAFATGFADIEKKTVMSVESRMPAGSIGKTFVSAVVLSMVSEGMLSLDQKIITWLGDELWFSHLPNHNMITLRHLLNHSSGLADHVFDANTGFQDYFNEHINSDNKEPKIDPTELVKLVLDKEPLFPAGEGFHYSDTNYILVGLIIEKAGRLTYYEELTNRFLTPLNLTHTSALT
ncbi:MAG: beta-lactamase family protein [Campylobacterales bacterium]|nr:beta-lactamase family protein [Campylobacterales bacterium]